MQSPSGDMNEKNNVWPLSCALEIIELVATRWCQGGSHQTPPQLLLSSPKWLVGCCLCTLLLTKYFLGRSHQCYRWCRFQVVLIYHMNLYAKYSLDLPQNTAFGLISWKNVVEASGSRAARIKYTSSFWHRFHSLSTCCTSTCSHSVSPVLWFVNITPAFKSMHF